MLYCLAALSGQVSVSAAKTVPKITALLPDPSLLQLCLRTRLGEVKNAHSLEHPGVILVSPDEDLSNGAEGLHNEVLVGLGNGRVAQQDLVLEPAGEKASGYNSCKYQDNRRMFHDGHKLHNIQLS